MRLAVWLENLGCCRVGTGKSLHGVLRGVGWDGIAQQALGFPNPLVPYKQKAELSSPGL